MTSPTKPATEALPDPWKDLADYLDEIGAPATALEHITKVIGFRPPPLWEAPRAEAEAINQSVKVPEGMRHVGWYCEHPWSNKPPYERLTKHRKVNRRLKRGWSEEKNVGKSLSFGDYDDEIGCPQRVPMFIREAS